MSAYLKNLKIIRKSVMDKTFRSSILTSIIAAAAISLVGLTLYTAFFGVFTDSIQRSAHLLLVVILVYAVGLQSSFDLSNGPTAGLKVILSRLWIFLILDFLAFLAFGDFLNM